MKNNQLMPGWGSKMAPILFLYPHRIKFPTGYSKLALTLLGWEKQVRVESFIKTHDYDDSKEGWDLWWNEYWRDLIEYRTHIRHLVLVGSHMQQIYSKNPLEEWACAVHMIGNPERLGEMPVRYRRAWNRSVKNILNPYRPAQERAEGIVAVDPIRRIQDEVVYETAPRILSWDEEEITDDQQPRSR